MKALIIDDSRAMRMIIGRILKEVGIEYGEAANGNEALNKLREGSQYDLALVDWNMPDMNGYDFVVNVRQDHTFDGLRLMMVTTETEMGNVQKAVAAGANEYVMKPFTKEVILDKLGLMGFANAA